MIDKNLASDLLEALDIPPDVLYLHWADGPDLTGAEKKANRKFREWRSRHPDTVLDIDLRWSEDVITCLPC